MEFVTIPKTTSNAGGKISTAHRFTELAVFELIAE